MATVSSTQDGPILGIWACRAPTSLSPPSIAIKSCRSPAALTTSGDRPPRSTAIAWEVGHAPGAQAGDLAQQAQARRAHGGHAFNGLQGGQGSVKHPFGQLRAAGLGVVLGRFGSSPPRPAGASGLVSRRLAQGLLLQGLGALRRELHRRAGVVQPFRDQLTQPLACSSWSRRISSRVFAGVAVLAGAHALVHVAAHGLGQAKLMVLVLMGEMIRRAINSCQLAATCGQAARGSNRPLPKRCVCEPRV